MLPLSRQTGISLISVMIGLVISMIALLGILSLYGNVVSTTVNSTQDAQVAGERSSALLVASMQMQGAGYGIDSPSRSNDLLLADATLDKGKNENEDSGSLKNSVDKPNEGNTLIWRFRSDGSSLCAGLHVALLKEQGQQQSNGYWQLYLLLPRTCSDVKTFDNWKLRRLIDISKGSEPPPPVTISLTEHQVSNPCRVLGIAGTGRLSVSLGTTDRKNNEIVSTTCLLNFTSE